MPVCEVVAPAQIDGPIDSSMYIPLFVSLDSMCACVSVYPNGPVLNPKPEILHGLQIQQDGTHRLGSTEIDCCISVAQDVTFIHPNPNGSMYVYSISLAPQVVVWDYFGSTYLQNSCMDPLGRALLVRGSMLP